VPLSATQTNPFGLKATPHPFFKFGSVCGAETAPLETSAVAVNDEGEDVPELFELEPPPPHDTSVAIAAPHATKPNTTNSDFMTHSLL
jgi:hypothetical protein